MKKLLFIAPLLLAACGQTTPEAKYYSLDQSYQITLRTAIAYVDECKASTATNPCHGTLPKIKQALDVADAAFDQADKVFVTRDSKFYDLSLSAAENALNAIQLLLKGAAHE